MWHLRWHASMCQQQKANGGKYAFTLAHAQIILIIGNSRASEQGKIYIWLNRKTSLVTFFSMFIWDLFMS